jgi:uncharacterized protein YdbL (DUF1318 family)
LLITYFGLLIFVVFISPPLLSLFLLRRPSFWRVLLHVATAFYILWIIYAFFTFSAPPNLLWKYVNLIFLLVYSGAALVAGLPEATAAGRVGETGLLRRVAALAFSRSYVHLIAFRRQPSYRHLSSVHHSRGSGSAEESQPLRRFKDGGARHYLAAVVMTVATASAALLIRYTPSCAALRPLGPSLAAAECVPRIPPRVCAAVM